MGKLTRERRAAFFAAHPNCIFCRGNSVATTIEHCPPRALFQFKQWPEGFEFPACITCNSGTANQDAVIAMLARMDPVTDRGNKDGKLTGLIANVHAHHPGMIRKMMLSPSEARKQNRKLGLTPPVGGTHQDTGAVRVTAEMDAAVRVLASKLSKAIYFQDSAKAFPPDGCLLLNWFSNADIFSNGHYKIFAALKDIPGSLPILKRTGNHLNEQFEFKYSVTEEKNLFALQVCFGNSFGFVVFGSSEPGLLEPTLQRLRDEFEKEGALAVLQSASLT